jgi:hypothetical protein
MRPVSLGPRRQPRSRLGDPLLKQGLQLVPEGGILQLAGELLGQPLLSLKLTCEARCLTEVPEVRWVRLPEDHDALANQWFLVTQTPEPIAFVGIETSPSDRIGQGGATDPARTWAGFVTDDPRLVGAIASHLHGLADRQAPAAPDGQGTAPSTMLLLATDDGTDPAYAVCRRAGLDLARREGATVVLYDRSSESYLVDPYESGPWTSQNHGPAGDRPWTSLSWSAWAAGTWSSRSPGPGIGAAGRGLAGPGHRCSRHGRRLPAPRGRPGRPPRQARPPVAAGSRSGPHPGRLPGSAVGQDHPRGRAWCGCRCLTVPNLRPGAAAAGGG